jgi:hypothetical protein
MNISIGTKIRFRSVIGSIIKATVEEIHGPILVVRSSTSCMVIHQNQIIEA